MAKNKLSIYLIKEDINEDLFKDYIEAVSNEAISWEGIREQLVKYHGFRYVPKSELEESKVREIKSYSQLESGY